MPWRWEAASSGRHESTVACVRTIWGGNPTQQPRLVLGDDEGCFAAALDAVRRNGGVLEHPEASPAWTGLRTPHATESRRVVVTACQTGFKLAADRVTGAISTGGAIFGFGADLSVAQLKGGTDAPDNLQLFCGNCNRIKGHRGMDYLKIKLQLR